VGNEQTEKATQKQTTPKKAPVSDEAQKPTIETKKKDPVRRWTLVILILLSVLFGWYLLADRFTPYTTQARLHALVVPIAPLISGQVEEVHVSNNQRVAAGDVLFTINTDTYRLALAAAETDLQSARQAVGASMAGVTAAEASLKAAEANKTKADQDAVRLRAIRKEDPGAISERRLQYAEAALAAAIADVDAAKANLEKARQDLGQEDENNFRILQAQVAIADAKLNISRATVRAPEDGLVTNVRVDRGNFAGSGQAQMTFIAIDNIWIQAEFTENNLGHIKPGDEAQILFDVLPGRLLEGKVRGTGFGVQIDSAPLGQLPTIENDKNWLRESQRFPVLVDFDTDSVKGLGLRVGSQASVTVYASDHAVLNSLGRLRMRIASYLTYAY
jgi:multidrug resistance efflux pump